MELIQIYQNAKTLSPETNLKLIPLSPDSRAIREAHYCDNSLPAAIMDIPA